MSRFLKAIATLSAVPVLAFAATASATGKGQVEGGDIYRIKNITKNVDFTDPANADACDVLMYKVRIHNPGPAPLTNVNVKATLPSGAATSQTSTITMSAADADPASTSDSALVKLSSSQSLAYQNGSTQLLDANNGFVKNLSDGITQGGVNIGNVGVSINEKRFVQFQVKVSCPAAPEVKLACTALDVKEVDKANGKFDFTAHGSATNANITSYKFVATDASNNQVDTNTVNTSATSAVYHFSQSKPGTYTVSTVVNTDKGNTKGSECVKQVTVPEKPTTPPTTPPQVQGTSTSLPNTGAGDVLGLFAGASGIGAAGHYMVRRFRRGQ